MKKFNFLFSAVALLTLVGCNTAKKDNSVSKEEFVAEAEKCEAHEYKTASLTVDMTENGQAEKGTYTYTFTAEAGWQADTEEGEGYESMLGLTAKDYVNAMGSTSAEDMIKQFETIPGMKFEIDKDSFKNENTYYLNPLRVNSDLVLKAKGSMQISEQYGMEMNIDMSGIQKYEFNTYGIVTSIYMDTNVTFDVKSNLPEGGLVTKGEEPTAPSGETGPQNQAMKGTVKIEYRD